VNYHDPLCPRNGPGGTYRECYCSLVARVRADERARWSPPTPAVPGHVPRCFCSRCYTGEVK
jgi:hypothetical protein